jgi:phosphoenolpyruvate synthase/pyruvate phosphate dikinase
VAASRGPRPATRLRACCAARRCRRGWPPALVAYTTDPGWTPLFVNAAAIVLEVGGVLQHGAVVAREYGKPCVVGINRVVTRLSDGETVEVDGTTGTVRTVAPPS